MPDRSCRPVADALATLDPADSNAGAGGKAAKARGGGGDGSGDAGGSGGSGGMAAKSRGGGDGGGDGGGGAIHPERQKRVRREMMEWMRNSHEVLCCVCVHVCVCFRHSGEHFASLCCGVFVRGLRRFCHRRSEIS